MTSAQLPTASNPPPLRLIRSADQLPMPWKNGGGVTTEIAASPAGSSLDTFEWRVSRAQVAADGPFSLFPGIDRTLVVLSGGGMVLDVAGGAPHELRPLETPFVFPGELGIHARLLAGPTRDFNVMTRRTLFSHRLTVLASGIRKQVTRTPTTRVFVHVLAGEAWGAEAGDSVLVPAGETSTFDVAEQAQVIVVELCEV